jgi:hypothetical protein
MAPFGGDKVPARVPGSGKLPALEDAPGSYVKLRLDAKQHAPAAPQTGITTQQLLDEVSKAVAPTPAPVAPPAIEQDARDELKAASRSNRSRREHDQLAAHDAPANAGAKAKAKARTKKQS